MNIKALKCKFILFLFIPNTDTWAWALHYLPGKINSLPELLRLNYMRVNFLSKKLYQWNKIV